MTFTGPVVTLTAGGFGGYSSALGLIPYKSTEMLTLQQAADLLMVSPEYLAGLLVSGEIHSLCDGDGIAVDRVSLEGFIQREERASRLVLDQLAHEAQELNMGY